jgi:hypothetical protein
LRRYISGPDLPTHGPSTEIYGSGAYAVTAGVPTYYTLEAKTACGAHQINGGENFSVAMTDTGGTTVPVNEGGISVTSAGRAWLNTSLAVPKPLTLSQRLSTRLPTLVSQVMRSCDDSSIFCRTLAFLYQSCEALSSFFRALGILVML